MPYESKRPNLPVLTKDLQGIGGIIKKRPEDFVVEEVPLYEPSGEGTHLYALIEKKGVTTINAIGKIAKALNIRRKDVGFAGLKDTHAITRQWMSVEHIAPEVLSQLRLHNIKVLQLARHRNKIMLGHLAGNRFAIRIRDCALPVKEALARAEEILQVLARRGVPNFFGPQRFGNRYDGHILGRAIIMTQIDEFMDIFLGHPQPSEPPVFLTARTFYDRGDYQSACDAWPHPFCEHRRALKRLLMTGGDRKAAYSTIDGHLKRLFISAYQSHIFNKALVVRMPMIDSLLQGDMAMKHENGACFRVDNPEVEQPRCDAFEVSPTGPIFGRRMTGLTGPAGEIENPIVDEARQLMKEAPKFGRHVTKGARRPLRFRPKDVKLSVGRDDLGDHIELQFQLDSGCYATVFLRELMKCADP